MLLDETVIDQLNKDADELAAKFDDLILHYTEKKDVLPDYIPYVILAATASVITKLAMATQEGRESVLDTLKLMIPDDMVLKAMSTQSTLLPPAPNIH